MRSMAAFRLTVEARTLLRAIAKARGTSQSAVLEQAIRRIAKAELNKETKQ